MNLPFDFEFDSSTDRNALQWLKNINDLPGRLIRVRLRLPENIFVIDHGKGRNNRVIDMLSRIPTSGNKDVLANEALPHFVTATGDVGDELLKMIA